MTERELPPAEWGRLTGTEFEPVLAQLDPRFTKIAVVEDEDGQIVGCWGAFLMVHAECVWVAPAHRGRAAVARRLWRMMRKMAADWGAEKVITGADSPEVHALLATRAVSLAPQYVLPLPERVH